MSTPMVIEVNKLKTRLKNAFDKVGQAVAKWPHMPTCPYALRALPCPRDLSMPEPVGRGTVGSTTAALRLRLPLLRMPIGCAPLHDGAGQHTGDIIDAHPT